MSVYVKGLACNDGFTQNYQLTARFPSVVVVLSLNTHIILFS